MIHIPDLLLTRLMQSYVLRWHVFRCNYLFRKKRVSKTSGKKSLFSPQHLGVLEFKASAVKEEIKNSTVAFGLGLFPSTQRNNTGPYDTYT